MDGNRLRSLRKEKKLTQKELGSIINVSKVSISGYESGDRTPDTDNLRRLADFFDVTSDYLLGRSEHPKLAEEEDKEVNKRVEEYMKVLEGMPEDRRKEMEEKILAYAQGLADANKED